MAVQDAEAPGREDEQAGAGNRILTIAIVSAPLFALESGRDQRHEQRRGEDAEQYEDRRDEREQCGDRSGHSRGLLMLLTRDERRIDRNKRRRQRTFAEQVLQKIGDPEGRHERVGRVGEAEVLSEESLADEAGEAAAEDPEGDERRGAVHGLYASPQRRRDAKNLFRRVPAPQRLCGET